MIKDIKDHLNELRVASYFYEEDLMSLDSFKRILIRTQKELPNSQEEDKKEEIIN